MRSALCSALHVVLGASLALAPACNTSPSAAQTAPAPAPAPDPAPAPGPAPAPTPDADAAPPALESIADVEYLEIVTGGAQADAELPMIVAIHGLGDDPRHFSNLFAGFDRPARVIFPRGLDAHEPGWSWFPLRARSEDVEGLSAGIAKAADTLAPAIAALAKSRPTAGKPIVTGFSQGGMLTFTLAVHHGELFAAAFPLGGWFPPPLMAAEGKSEPSVTPPIRAFHGDSDRAVAHGPTKTCVEALATAGYDAELKTYPGVGHAIPPKMHADLMAGVRAALDAQTAPEP